jgi:hypothetical protein
LVAGDLRNYGLVTGAYWGFTLTDGALRMLVLLHFDRLGYDPITIAFLFLFYEFFGIVTNLIGGWIATRLGLKATLYGGLTLQILALGMLALLQPHWSETTSVIYVMAAQALSGIAKDLTKMSSKSAIKLVVPEGAEGTLFRWVSRLTGSKNALKGAGFFLGGVLLTGFGFAGSLWAMAAALVVVLLGTVVALPAAMGIAKKKVKFATLLSKSTPVNWLSAARLFLFGARDVWFVVALPVFLASTLGWSYPAVGAFIASWFIGYGAIQAVVPHILRRSGDGVDGGTARSWAFVLASIPAALGLVLMTEADPGIAVIVGLGIFGVVFAINSAIHSYLILAYTDADSVALDVGFYYMANAAGRLLGTLLSGLVFQFYGFVGCLAVSAAMVAIAALLSLNLPRSLSAPIGGAPTDTE